MAAADYLDHYRAKGFDVSLPARRLTVVVLADDRSFAAYAGNPIAGLALLSCGAIGIWSALGPCWALPMRVLSGPAAAAGLALINSIGNVGGFVGPSLVGWARQATNSFEGGLLVIAASMIGAAIVAVSLKEAPKAPY